MSADSQPEAADCCRQRLSGGNNLSLSIASSFLTQYHLKSLLYIVSYSFLIWPVSLVFLNLLIRSHKITTISFSSIFHGQEVLGAQFLKPSQQNHLSIASSFLTNFNCLSFNDIASLVISFVYLLSNLNLSSNFHNCILTHSLSKRLCVWSANLKVIFEVVVIQYSSEKTKQVIKRNTRDAI